MLIQLQLLARPPLSGLIFYDVQTKPTRPIDTSISFKIFVLNVADLNFVFTAGPLSPTMRK